MWLLGQIQRSESNMLLRSSSYWLQSDGSFSVGGFLWSNRVWIFWALVLPPLILVCIFPLVLAAGASSPSIYVSVLLDPSALVMEISNLRIGQFLRIYLKGITWFTAPVLLVEMVLWKEELIFIPFFLAAASPNKRRSTTKEPYAFWPVVDPPPESMVYFIVPVLSGEVVSAAFFMDDD